MGYEQRTAESPSRIRHLVLIPQVDEHLLAEPSQLAAGHIERSLGLDHDARRLRVHAEPGRATEGDLLFEYRERVPLAAGAPLDGAGFGVSHALEPRACRDRLSTVAQHDLVHLA